MTPARAWPSRKLSWHPLYFTGFGASAGSVRLSRPDRLSTWDRRSPISAFSFSDRVSIPDRRSLLVRLSAPARFLSSPIVVSAGCRESSWIAHAIIGCRHKPSRGRQAARQWSANGAQSRSDQATDWLQPHAVRNRSAHTLQAVHEPAVVIVLVPKIEDGENDQRRHESSHGRFSFLGSDLHPGVSLRVNDQLRLEAARFRERIVRVEHEFSGRTTTHVWNGLQSVLSFVDEVRKGRSDENLVFFLHQSARPAMGRADASLHAEPCLVVWKARVMHDSHNPEACFPNRAGHRRATGGRRCVIAGDCSRP
jgi:hypothetical protein